MFLQQKYHVLIENINPVVVFKKTGNSFLKSGRNLQKIGGNGPALVP